MVQKVSAGTGHRVISASRFLPPGTAPGPAGSTWVVPAAAGGAAPQPAALVHRNGPLMDLIVLQRVWSQVTDLNLGVVLLEVLKGHPA